MYLLFAPYSYNHLHLKVIKSELTCIVCKRIFKERGGRGKEERRGGGGKGDYEDKEKEMAKNN